MLLVLRLSLLAFATLAVVGVPLDHASRATQATSVTLNGVTYINQVSAQAHAQDANRQNPYDHLLLGPCRIRAHPVQRH